MKYILFSLIWLLTNCVQTKYNVGFPKQPILMPLPSSDTRNFVLMEDFPVYLDDKLIVVPKGFNTDLSSVPQLFESVIANDDPRILRPSILHDWEYFNTGKLDIIVMTRDDCDHSLADGMKTEGASKWLRSGVYRAVRYGGEKYWNGHIQPK